VAADPEPQDIVASADAKSTIIVADPCGVDRLNRMYAPEMQAGMPGILDEASVGFPRLSLHV